MTNFVFARKPFPGNKGRAEINGRIIEASFLHNCQIHARTQYLIRPVCQSGSAAGNDPARAADFHSERKQSDEPAIRRGPKLLPKGVTNFLAEAWSIRKSLVHPPFREVLKLTVIAVVFIAIAMAAITGLDSILSKIIAEPIIRRWAEDRAKLGNP